MSKFFKKALAALLVLALIAVLLPATATTAKAAAGDVVSGGYVLFEETFEKGADGNYLSGKPGTFYDSLGGTVSGGYISFTNGGTTSAARKKVNFTLSDLGIPSQTGGTNARCYVGIKIEVFVAESTARNAFLQIVDVTTAGGTYNSGSGKFINGSASSIIPPQTATPGVFGLIDDVGTVTSMTVSFGVREGSAATNYLKIDGYRVSLVLVEKEGKQAAVRDMEVYLSAKTGFFQLQRDMELTSNLVMGTDAVLDLNGHTLTISGAGSLNAPVNAKIVDTSANKTGKIVCAEDALTIANTNHPTLPILVAENTYAFAEPKLVAGSHILAVKEQTSDAFTIHFRPGFGTLNGVNVREEYLASGESGITMSANITSVAKDGTRRKLQYNGSEDIALDGMFNGMYASAEARGQMTFEGFENFKALEITLKLTAGDTTCTLPTYTVNKLFASEFDTLDGITYNSAIEDGKLKITGTANISLAKAIATGAGNTMVMEFDLTIGKTLGMYEGGGFEVRDAKNARYYVFNSGIFGEKNQHNYIAQSNYVGTKHIRLEINLDTFAVSCIADGVATQHTPQRADASGFSAAWSGKSVINVSGPTANTPFVIDNLTIFSFETA